MKDLSKVKYFHITEKLSKILATKTMSKDMQFYRLMVSYNLAKIASMMRCNIQTPDRGDIPVSMYAINLAPSGHGKGHSTNVVEEQVINLFRKNFLNGTYPKVGEESLENLARERLSKKTKTTLDNEIKLVKKEFEALGVLPFSFDSGTTPAVKQMRHQLLMSGAGSMNMEIDEIGSNLLGNQDVLTTFLELFDVGRVKQKLIKNTSENKRNEEIDGRTPANMMLFGTPSKLLNGSKEEDEFRSMLSTGYGRRCFFGLSTNLNRTTDMTPKELYKILTDKSVDTYLTELSLLFGNLADSINFGNVLDVSIDVTLEMLEYQLYCDKRAAEYGEHDDIRITEMMHRHFKAIKLAGAHAFVDSSPEITSEHFWSAVKLAEDSGEALDRILRQDMPYMKVAKYIVSVGRPVTHADLAEELSFYKGTGPQKAETMKLAAAWAYQNNIVITTNYIDDIEFLEGTALKETDLKELMIAYSNDIALNYISKAVTFQDMGKLLGANGYHWINHFLTDAKKGHRKEENCVPGFNLIVLDVDSGIKIETAELLLKDYTYIIHTTKRHTPALHRFRIIMPISHVMHMSAPDFKSFMTNIYDWLPFEVDRQTNQRARKWMTHKGILRYNTTDKLLDALPFVPKTRKAEEQKKKLNKQQNFTSMERWFVNNTDEGNRSNMLIRYAYALVDSGKTIDEITDAVLDLNKKLKNSLPEIEITRTILKTAGKKITQRATQP